MTSPENMTAEQQYCTDLTIDGLISHLEAMKAAGARGDDTVIVNAYRVAEGVASARPNLPRAEWLDYGRVTFTGSSRGGWPALTVILDAEM